MSAEAALSFHGWIPERITQVTSVIATGFSRSFETPLGYFVYRKMPITTDCFYKGVVTEPYHQQRIHMATPLRALMDYVYWHKVKNADLDFLENSLRIEKTTLDEITLEEIDSLKPVYRASIVQDFLENVRQGLSNE